MGMEYETCFMSPFWCLEILDGALNCGKFANPWNRFFSGLKVNLSDVLQYFSSALQLNLAQGLPLCQFVNLVCINLVEVIERGINVWLNGRDHGRNKRNQMQHTEQDLNAWSHCPNGIWILHFGNYAVINEYVKCRVLF